MTVINREARSGGNAASRANRARNADLMILGTSTVLARLGDEMYLDCVSVEVPVVLL